MVWRKHLGQSETFLEIIYKIFKTLSMIAPQMMIKFGHMMLFC
jgi:hypothetical protein